MAQAKAEIGLVGMAVMGRNLMLNMDDHGYTVAVSNRTVPRVDEFLPDGARGAPVVEARARPV